MKNLIKPENCAEALALQSLLREHGITAQLLTFHDTAYDGLFQLQYGWGVIRVAGKDFARAEQIVREWKGTPPGDLSWENIPSEPAE